MGASITFVAWAKREFQGHHTQGIPGTPYPGNSRNSRDTILISVSALFSSLVSAAGEYDPTVLQAARQNHRALRVVRSAHGGVGSRSPLRRRRSEESPSNCRSFQAEA